MSNYPEHICPETDEMGHSLRPMMVTCGNCYASWCERCDPAPSALCHWCNGRGHSIAPIPPRQRRAMGVHYPAKHARKVAA